MDAILTKLDQMFGGYRNGLSSRIGGGGDYWCGPPSTYRVPAARRAFDKKNAVVIVLLDRIAGPARWRFALRRGFVLRCAAEHPLPSN